MKNPITFEQFIEANEIVDAMDNNYMEFNEDKYQEAKGIISDFNYFSRKEKESHYIAPHYPNAIEGSIFDY